MLNCSYLHYAILFTLILFYAHRRDLRRWFSLPLFSLLFLAAFLPFPIKSFSALTSLPSVLKALPNGREVNGNTCWEFRLGTFRLFMKIVSGSRSSYVRKALELIDQNESKQEKKEICKEFYENKRVKLMI